MKIVHEPLFSDSPWKDRTPIANARFSFTGLDANTRISRGHMPLSIGTRLGGVQILSALGAGGMGEVYRARDTRLDRDVAIKILPQAFFADAERVVRFQTRSEDPRFAE